LSNVGQRLVATVAARDSLPALMRPNSTPLGAPAALAGAGNNQVALEPASPPKTVRISRPCGVVVSAQASCNERKVALAAPMALSGAVGKICTPEI
jgi:hypothetical protein